MPVRLTDEENAMLAGAMGRPRQWAIQQQVSVAGFFDAPDLVPIAHVHMMADTESLGVAGVEFLEGFAREPEATRRMRVPTVTDPRGTDFKAYQRLRQTETMATLERRAIDAFRAMGVMMTDTCINYQIVLPPVLGEHLAFGDTGSVIYANSVCGARTNYEGGPAALAAGLSGRTPRYGYHLDRNRLGTLRFVVADQPRGWTDWGVLGGIVGRATNSYWKVPVIEGVATHPTSDELKHFGAALASYGSVALFHMIGVTPEAPDAKSVFAGPLPAPTVIDRRGFDAFYQSFRLSGDRLDVVVFAAPQLSLMETQRLAGLLQGQRVKAGTTLIACTAPEVKAAADRMGFTAAIEGAGGLFLEGVCFYQMYAREIGEAQGWKRLMSNSAKLVNIISGYGFEPVLADMETCVASALAGRMVR
ncbi:MAG: DUF521 domain-containing protein [Alphaproteobacteria bacterium]|nr:DUF521 domain-containing protein [Alphaproteobacteria bacterium]